MCHIFACAEILSNTVCIVFLMREGLVEPRLTSNLTEDALELVVLLPLSLGAGIQVCAATLSVFETVLAGVDLAE